MNWNQRLEDARARRHVVLQQRDRIIQAAKAAQGSSRPAKASPKPGDAQDIARARPEGTNARAVEAALRKRNAPPPPTSAAANEPRFQIVEDEASENIANIEVHTEAPAVPAAKATVAPRGPAKQRRSLTAKRIVFAGLAVLAGFGFGVFGGPLIVARIQGPDVLPPTSITQDVAPLQPSAALAQVVGVSSDVSDIVGARAPSLDRAVPANPALIAFSPKLPLVSPAPPKAPDRVAGTLISPPDPDAGETGAATISTVRPLQREASADAVAADISPAPRLDATAGTQIAKFLGNQDELPSLPLKSIAPNVPSTLPGALSTVTGDGSASVDITLPPAAVKRSLRLTGIGSLGAYKVHLRSPGSLSDGNLAEVTAVIGQTGLPIGNLTRVSYAISASHVRYYYRRDAVAAAALAERIGARSRDFTSFRPSPQIGTLEVFLSGSSGSSVSERAAAQSRTQPAQLDAEFIELRDRLLQSLRQGDHL